MRGEEFRVMLREEVKRLAELNKSKGGDYSGEDDALGFFREQAQEMGTSAERGWIPLARKHWQAVLTYCRRSEDDGYQPSEGVEGRIRDLILYLFLLLALVRERPRDEDFDIEPEMLKQSVKDSPPLKQSVKDSPLRGVEGAQPYMIWVCPKHGPLLEKSVQPSQGTDECLVEADPTNSAVSGRCFRNCTLVCYGPIEVPDQDKVQRHLDLMSADPRGYPRIFSGENRP